MERVCFVGKCEKEKVFAYLKPLLIPCSELKRIPHHPHCANEAKRERKRRKGRKAREKKKSNYQM